MPCDPFRQNHKRIAANKLLEIYGDLDNQNLFLSIGKIGPWKNENDPPIALDSVMEDTDFWRGIYAHKRIDRSDVSLVVRRYDWKPGVIYTPYSDDVDLFDDLNPAPFYVLVDEERVYKCIDNNYGTPSFNAPTHTDARVRRLADGYRWKFLYQISESKRKFLTKTQSNSIGYMPIEYVEYLRLNDERILQWNVQESAVDGEIAYIRVNPDVQPFVVSDKCVFPSGENIVVADVFPGATGITVTSPHLIYAEDRYKNLTLSIDSGNGLGQRREITSFVSNNIGTSAFITVKEPFIKGISGGSGASTFSIVPTIRVVGDGSSNNNPNNPYATGAEIMVRFGVTAASELFRQQGLTTCDELVESVKLIDSIEIVDGGKNYTFASLDYIAGLTVPTGKVFINDLADPIMSPPGGHGSNPVKELGTSSIMLVKEYTRSENDKVSTENEYRQFGLILNPLLAEKQVRIRFFENGLSGSFEAGETASQTVTGSYGVAYGNVVSWLYGVSGHSGTNELVLTNVRGSGDFSFGGTIDGLKILNVDEKTVAGTESRQLAKLTLAPTLESGFLAGNQCRCTGGNDFLDGMIVHGIGNYETTMEPSRAVGQIYKWEPKLGSNKSGFLYVENISGEFKKGERVDRSDWFYKGIGSRGLSGIAEIVAIDTLVRDGVNAYDQTTSLELSWESPNFFDKDSFVEDNYYNFVLGTTASANGYVVAWEPGASGVQGKIRFSGTQGKFQVGMTAAYPTSPTTEAVATVVSVLHEAELKYRSGDILYIQNMKPIQRSGEQKEEIKIVIDF
jgi:hypothetical protein